jgi:orotidine-5'-phosphate decarboxylase
MSRTFFLVPGVGEQGGDLERTIISGMNQLGGLLINVSRSISYPNSEVVLENYVRQQVAGLAARMKPFIS